MSWLAAAQLGGTALGFLGGLGSSSSQKKYARKAYAAALQNAESFLQQSQIRNGVTMGIAGINAGMIRNIGEANAQLVERTTAWNAAIEAMDFKEQLRLHERQEKHTAGRIRAMAAGSGFSANVGTPMHYLHSEVREGLRSRKFLHDVATLSITATIETGKDQAAVTRYEAEQRAHATMASAHLQVGADMQIAQLQYQGMLRDASLARMGDMDAARATQWGAFGDLAMGVGQFGYQQGWFGQPQLPGRPTIGTPPFNPDPAHAPSYGDPLSFGLMTNFLGRS